MEKKKSHYAWIILIATCALQAGTMGILMNSAGIFFSPVADELNVGVGSISLYLTIFMLVMTFMFPVLGRVLQTVNIRIAFSAGFIVCIVALGLMSQYTAVWHFYLSAIAMGLVAPLFFLSSPIMIGNWFEKKQGLAMGISAAFASLGGVILNPIISYCIIEFGWRTSYIIIAIIGAIVVLPFSLFVIRLRPEDMGLKPFGHEVREEKDEFELAEGTSNQEGVPASKAVKSLAFISLFLGIGLLSFLGGYSQQLPSYALSIGFTATIGGTLVSISLIGSIASKLLLGALADKFGIKNVVIGGTIVVIIGFISLLMSNGNITFIIIGAVLYGANASLYNVGTPLLTRSVFGNKDFATIYSYISVGQSLVGALGVSTVGFIYDASGSYIMTFILGIIVSAVAIFAIVGTYLSKKRLAWEKNKKALA